MDRHMIVGYFFRQFDTGIKCSCGFYCASSAGLARAEAMFKEHLNAAPNTAD